MGIALEEVPRLFDQFHLRRAQVVHSERHFDSSPPTVDEFDMALGGLTGSNVMTTTPTLVTPQALASGLSWAGLGLYISRGIVAAHCGSHLGRILGQSSRAAFHFALQIGSRGRGDRRHHKRRRSHGKRGS